MPIVSDGPQSSAIVRRLSYMDGQERTNLICKEAESLRNLRPKTFAVATDPEADMKARWTAFDELYLAVREAIVSKGHEFEDSSFDEAESQRSARFSVALALMMASFGWNNEASGAAMIQAEELVPSPPDPDTGRPTLTAKDQALLQMITRQLETDLPEDWECFYKGESESVERRKAAFARLYWVVAQVWMEYSLFPHRLTPEVRQKFVILAFMCHVPREQWTTEDLRRLESDLLPVPEPEYTSV